MPMSAKFFSDILILPLITSCRFRSFAFSLDSASCSSDSLQSGGSGSVSKSESCPQNDCCVMVDVEDPRLVVAVESDEAGTWGERWEGTSPWKSAGLSKDELEERKTVGKNT